MNFGEYCPLQYIILHSQDRAIWYTARDNFHQYSCNNPIVRMSDYCLSGLLGFIYYLYSLQSMFYTIYTMYSQKYHNTSMLLYTYDVMYYTFLNFKDTISSTSCIVTVILFVIYVLNYTQIIVYKFIMWLFCSQGCHWWQIKHYCICCCSVSVWGTLLYPRNINFAAGERSWIELVVRFEGWSKCLHTVTFNKRVTQMVPI